MGGGWAGQYDNDVFVYDTAKALFGTIRSISTSDPTLMPAGCGGYPIDANVPQVNVRGDRIFGIGGECNDRVIGGERYTHYPALAVVGRISAV